MLSHIYVGNACQRSISLYTTVNTYSERHLIQIVSFIIVLLVLFFFFFFWTLILYGYHNEDGNTKDFYFRVFLVLLSSSSHHEHRVYDHTCTHYMWIYFQMWSILYSNERITFSCNIWNLTPTYSVLIGFWWQCFNVKCEITLNTEREHNM